MRTRKNGDESERGKAPVVTEWTDLGKNDSKKGEELKIIIMLVCRELIA